MNPTASVILKFWLFFLTACACARGNNTSGQYVSLDVYYGTRQEPCTNDLNGWSPSLDALKDPKKCYGIEGDHYITCISRRTDRLNDEERRLCTTPLHCTVNGFQNNKCAGPTYWPAQFNPQDQTWTWDWDREVELVDLGSFTIECQ